MGKPTYEVRDNVRIILYDAINNEMKVGIISIFYR